MSVRRATLIECDCCDEIAHEYDLSCETASIARSNARSDGWHVNRPGGRDVCPECWEDGLR